MTKRFLTIALLFITCTIAFSQADTEYSQTLKKLFEVSGTEETYQSVVKQMFVIFKKQYSDVETEIWNEFEKEFSSTSLNELTEMLVPVYSKHLSTDELQEIIKFYETPIGKKFAESSPLITQEAMQVGQEWGMKIGQEFARKMKEKGY